LAEIQMCDFASELSANEQLVTFANTVAGG